MKLNLPLLISTLSLCFMFPSNVEVQSPVNFKNLIKLSFSCLPFNSDKIKNPA